MNNEVTDDECMQMGRSMLLIGVRRAIALLDAQARSLEAQLQVVPAAVPGNGHAEIRPAMKRTMALIEAGEPDVVRKKKGSGSRDYWARLTPAQRSKEMRRRMRVAVRNREAAGL